MATSERQDYKATRLANMSTIKSGRSEFLHQLPDGRVVAWGWSFRSGRDPFRPAIGTSPVTVFAYVSGLNDRSDIVPTRIVGHARLVSEAARLGRAALRQHILPVVRDFAEKQGVSISPTKQ